MEQQPETPLESTTSPYLTDLAEEPGTMATPTSTPEAEQPWQEWVQPVTDFLSDLPDELSNFFGNYKQPLVTVGLIATALVTVKITFALIGAINEIPLLAPTFELVGISYTAWFVYRYLLKASNRGELIGEFDALKSQVFGKKD